jgi:hypothetical protein
MRQMMGLRFASRANTDWNSGLPVRDKSRIHEIFTIFFAKGLATIMSDKRRRP